ncbi:Cobalamin synthase [compost metagenome]
MSDKGRPILAAFQFLSRFPVKTELDFTPELMRRSAQYYPLVGVSIGIVAAAVGAAAHLAIPSLPAAILMLIIWVWLTGGLHLDGWMDSADALLSYRSREKMLEIMKDSRVGAMGVLACVLLLMLKASLLSSLLDEGLFATCAAICTAPVWSRWFMGWAMRAWPLARQGEGLAARFHGIKNRYIAVATVLSLVLSAAALLAAYALDGDGASLPLLALYYVLSPLITLAAGALAASRMSARLGGLTGDTYGALNEGLEAVLLLLALIIL